MDKLCTESHDGATQLIKERTNSDLSDQSQDATRHF